MDKSLTMMEEIVQSAFTHWGKIAVSTFIVWFIYAYAVKPYIKLKKLGLPGPRYIPFIGSTEFVFERAKLHVNIKKLCDKYGDIFCFSGLGAPIIFIKDLEMIKEIKIKEFHKFNAPRDLRFSFPPKRITSNFMSITSGEKWANQRHTLSPAFSASCLKHILKLMNDSCDTLIDKKLKPVADNGEPVEIYDWLKNLTLETILASAFGVKSETQMTENDYVAQLSKRAMEPRKLILALFAIPFGRTIINYLPDPFSFGELGDVAQKIIDSRKVSGQKKRDLLQLMLDARNNAEGKKLDDDEIVAQSVLFLLAGFETTSTTLGFLCHHLSLDRAMQEKARQDVDEHWTDDEEFPSYDSLHSMKYLEMIIKETLRMYPAGFITQRFCGEDCTIKGMNFRKDDMILFPIYAIHHDPKYYPEPEKFDPMRFSPEQKAEREQLSYLPFGEGPRMCIGKRFALMEMKLVMARILREFTLETCSKTQNPLKPIVENVLRPPKEGVWVEIKSRKKNE